MSYQHPARYSSFLFSLRWGLTRQPRLFLNSLQPKAFLQSQSPKCWGYRLEPPHPAFLPLLPKASLDWYCTSVHVFQTRVWVTRKISLKKKYEGNIYFSPFLCLKVSHFTIFKMCHVQLSESTGHDQSLLLLAGRRAGLGQGSPSC